MPIVLGSAVIISAGAAFSVWWIILSKDPLPNPPPLWGGELKSNDIALLLSGSGIALFGTL